MNVNKRVEKWAKLSLAAMAGLCLGGGCSVRGLNALVVGLEAAADELNGHDDDSFVDWLENKWDDNVNDLEDLLD